VAIISALAKSQELMQSSLKLVQVIIRHGQRTPEYPYPTDRYKSWEEGWGQLTEEGKRQEYELGQYLRSRYGSFISDNYKANQIHAVSSGLDRTVMSAQLCLAGMYPTENGTTWNPDLKWQPVPVYTIPLKYDNMLKYNESACPQYAQIIEDLRLNTPYFKELNSNNSALYQILTEKSGVNVQTLMDIDDFYATMMAEELLGLGLPTWAQPVVSTENFQMLYNLSFAVKTWTPEAKKLRAGPILADLNAHFHERIVNQSMETKFFLYSAHDNTMINVLHSLDIYDLLRPPYGSAMMLELHERVTASNYNGVHAKDEYFVKIFLRNDTTRDPYLMKLPNCAVNCPYEEFYRILGPILPGDWDMECQVSKGFFAGMNPIVKYVLAVLVGALLFGIIYLLVTKLCLKTRRRTEEYQRF